MSSARIPLREDLIISLPLQKPNISGSREPQWDITPFMLNPPELWKNMIKYNQQ